MEKEKSFRVVTHPSADDDEFVAIEIIERWGQHEFPGVRYNPLLTVDAGVRMTADQIQKWLDGGHVLVGTGGPLVDFDEHGKGDGRSAATEAANHYKISDDPALIPILAYSLRADDRAEDHPFAMASLVKNLHASGVVLEKVRAMHRRWFDALYGSFSGIIIFNENRTTFRQMAIVWLISLYKKLADRTLIFGSFADAMVAIGLTPGQVDEVREIARFVDRDNTKGAFSNFDLNGLVQAMQITGVSETTIMDDVRTVLDAKLSTQKEFIEAKQFFLEHALYVDDWRVAVVHSDNRQMSRAARATDEHLIILIQKRSSGHMQIFSDQQRDLRPILWRIRALEFCSSRQKGNLSHTELSASGTHPRVPQWYGFEKYDRVISIFNGTLKTRFVPKTRLTVDEIVRCVRDGLKHTYHTSSAHRKKQRT